MSVSLSLYTIGNSFCRIRAVATRRRGGRCVPQTKQNKTKRSYHDQLRTASAGNIAISKCLSACLPVCLSACLLSICLADGLWTATVGFALCTKTATLSIYTTERLQKKYKIPRTKAGVRFVHGDAREVDMTGADVIWLNDAVSMSHPAAAASPCCSLLCLFVATQCGMRACVTVQLCSSSFAGWLAVWLSGCLSGCLAIGLVHSYPFSSLREDGSGSAAGDTCD
jgi:hypothetical protein